MIDYRVYLVTDDPSRYAGDWLANVAAAVNGGVTCVQYRDTENEAGERYTRACALKRLLDAAHVPLIVNDDVALALAVNAAGVHVGQSDLPPSVVRRLVGPEMEIGYSITRLDQLASPECAYADCFGIGPVFDATATKSDAAPEMGVQGLASVITALNGRPNVAIGGITLERAPSLIAAGAGGLAVVSAFSRSADPRSVAAGFRSFFN